MYISKSAHKINQKFIIYNFKYISRRCARLLRSAHELYCPGSEPFDSWICNMISAVSPRFHNLLSDHLIMAVTARTVIFFFGKILAQECQKNHYRQKNPCLLNRVQMLSLVLIFFFLLSILFLLQLGLPQSKVCAGEVRKTSQKLVINSTDISINGLLLISHLKHLY